MNTLGIVKVLDKGDYIVLDCSSPRDDSTNEALNLFLYRLNPKYLSFDRNIIYIEGPDNMKLVRDIFQAH